MNKYKNIHVTPEFHLDFKVFAAKQGASMGELIEKITREYMRNFESRTKNEEENK